VYENIPAFSLLIKCPECRALVDTGVTMDKDSFCTSEFEERAVECKDFKYKSVWNKDDVQAISFC
jgi:hypothetical protein